MGVRRNQRVATTQRSAATETRRPGRLDDTRVIRHPDTAIAVPVLDDGRIVLIRQYRPLIARWSIECPGGVREPNEEPAATAARELREEIGFEITDVRLSRSVFASFGYSTEQVFIFVAWGALSLPPRRRPDESTIETTVWTAGDIPSLLNDRDVIDAKTVIALSDYAMQYGRE